MANLTTMTGDVDSETLATLLSVMDDDTAAKHVPLYRETPVNILAHDMDNRLIAGLLGKIVWDWLYIDTLWVDPDKRGQDIGADLVKQAEQEARNSHCIGVWLWTQSFQAPGFYQKLGYKEFAMMDNFPRGHQRIGFMKQLAA